QRNGDDLVPGASEGCRECLLPSWQNPVLVSRQRVIGSVARPGAIIFRRPHQGLRGRVWRGWNCVARLARSLCEVYLTVATKCPSVATRGQDGPKRWSNWPKMTNSERVARRRVGLHLPSPHRPSRRTTDAVTTSRGPTVVSRVAEAIGTDERRR